MTKTTEVKLVPQYKAKDGKQIYAAFAICPFCGAKGSLVHEDLQIDLKFRCELTHGPRCGSLFTTKSVDFDKRLVVLEWTPNEAIPTDDSEVPKTPQPEGTDS